MSKYSISTVDASGTATEVDSRSDKTAAITRADALHAEQAGAVKVIVTTEAGNEVHVQESVSAVSTRTKPWAKTDTPPFPHPTLEGHTPAYFRTRVLTVVYRADDKSGWVIIDTRKAEGDEGYRKEFENTATGRAWTNQLEAEYKVTRAQERDAAKAERKRLAAEKKTARDADKAAKAQAKLEAKQAKDAEKAAKEAAKAATDGDTAEVVEEAKELVDASV